MGRGADEDPNSWMGDKNVSQKCDVIEYLRRHGSITRWQAFRDLGIAELSARICELTREGFDIPRETVPVVARNGRVVRVTEYRAPVRWP